MNIWRRQCLNHKPDDIKHSNRANRINEKLAPEYFVSSQSKVSRIFSAKGQMANIVDFVGMESLSQLLSSAAVVS